MALQKITTRTFTPPSEQDTLGVPLVTAYDTDDNWDETSGSTNAEISPYPSFFVRLIVPQVIKLTVLQGEADENEPIPSFQWPKGDIEAEQRLEQRLLKAQQLSESSPAYQIQTQVLTNFAKQGYLDMITDVCAIAETAFGISTITETAGQASKRTCDDNSGIDISRRIGKCYDIVDAICYDLQSDLGFILTGETTNGLLIRQDPHYI